VQLWSIADPARPTLLGEPLTGHQEEVEAVAFSSDGHTLASASLDQTIRLWNVSDPTHPTASGQPLIGHTSSILAVAFSPDKHTLATGSADQTIRLWDLNVDHAIRRICATTPNTLTSERWKQYVSTDVLFDPPCP
jgi:WD40 repeat protein